MKHYYPNFDDFLKYCEKGNTVPVYRELLADALTPVSAYQRLAKPLGYAPASHSFLLESVVGGERIAQYSFVAANPEAVFTARRNEICISKLNGDERDDFLRRPAG